MIRRKEDPYAKLYEEQVRRLKERSKAREEIEKELQSLEYKQKRIAKWKEEENRIHLEKYGVPKPDKLSQQEPQPWANRFFSKDEAKIVYPIAMIGASLFTGGWLAWIPLTIWFSKYFKGGKR